jgi:hypothetical protein
MASVEVAAARFIAAEADDTSNIIGVLLFKDIMFWRERNLENPSRDSQKP